MIEEEKFESWFGKAKIFTELDFIKDKLRFEKKYGKGIKYIFEGKKIKR